ncbi:MAG: hypothetical protein LBI05_10215 [Planctomycetaceae bacterium]|nr:hypothetical protein [Planctomycetaceae bacterium]
MVACHSGGTHLIPSPLQISPQTTGITSPLLPNGDVDYFSAYEQTCQRTGPSIPSSRAVFRQEEV